mgnify:CR=1 FL=1
MTLIKSISGIRGTIGGNPEDGLNPLAIVKFVAAYATFIKKNTKVTTNKIVVGRDARISGEMVKNVVLAPQEGVARDRRGQPMTMKVRGTVEPYFRT